MVSGTYGFCSFIVGSIVTVGISFVSFGDGNVIHGQFDG